MTETTPAPSAETEYKAGYRTVDAFVSSEDKGDIDSLTWNSIVSTAVTQLKTSRDYKYPRMKEIQGNENLYMGVVEKEYKNPFNDCYPYMSGFVDQLMAEITDTVVVRFEPTDEADYRAAMKTSALFDNQIKSNLPHAQWGLKDRYAKKLAIFSGVAIMKYHTESEPFRPVLSNVDHYDFHNEPAGGGNLEAHLFCGEEGIFKTKEEIESGAESGWYDADSAKTLLYRTSGQQFKENTEAYNQRINRYRAMGLDPESNNYVGQAIFKLVEWYLTYNGCRYYCLFEERSMTAIRICKLRDMFSIIEPNTDALYPYVAWHTNEDPKIFWSKAPCDDVKPIAITINRLMNQQMYNRDKQNMGQRLYDPKMIKDVKSLSDWRVDGLTPVDTLNGQRNLSQAVFPLVTGNLTGTVELVQFLNEFTGQKTGSTPGSQGQAPSSQKVGIFYGEMQQISKRIGVLNRSYREAWAGIGLRFRVGLADNLGSTELAVKLMGAKGVEWSTISAEDTRTVRDFDIIVEGGNETQLQKQQENDRKANALKMVQTVNPKWKDAETLKAAGYTDAEIKEAWSMVDPGLKELLSEAAQAEQDIVSGKKVDLNRAANAAFMQHIMNFAENLSMKDKSKENELAIKLLTYAKAHAIIAAENEARSALRLINDEKLRMDAAIGARGNTGAPMARQQPTQDEMVQDPAAMAISQGNQISNQMVN